MNPAARGFMKPETSFALDYLGVGDISPGWRAVNYSKCRNLFWEEDDHCMKRIVAIFMLRPVGTGWGDARLRLSNALDVIKRCRNQIGHGIPDGAGNASDGIYITVLYLM